MSVWSRIRSTWAGTAVEPLAVAALPEPPATHPEPLSVDPGAAQEPISHVAVVPMHWLAGGTSDTAACGWPLADGAKWTIDTDRVTCERCQEVATVVSVAEPEPAPAIRKVHFACNTGSECGTRPASPAHITGDTAAVTCGACKRTYAYKAASR